MSKEFITEDRLQSLIECNITDNGYHKIDLGAALILFGYWKYSGAVQAQV